MSIIAKINQEQMKKDVTKFNVGDSVRVHTVVKEGDKERVQVFTGIVIGRKGTLLNESFTVRRISYGEGVERVFPLFSPRIASIELVRRGEVRRAKLYYLRGRRGKAARITERMSKGFLRSGLVAAPKTSPSTANSVAGPECGDTEISRSSGSVVRAGRGKRSPCITYACS